MISAGPVFFGASPCSGMGFREAHHSARIIIPISYRLCSCVNHDSGVIKPFFPSRAGTSRKRTFFAEHDSGVIKTLLPLSCRHVAEEYVLTRTMIPAWLRGPAAPAPRPSFAFPRGCAPLHAHEGACHKVPLPLSCKHVAEEGLSTLESLYRRFWGMSKGSRALKKYGILLQ